MSKTELSYSDLSKMIDHAILSPTLTETEIVNGIQLALAYDVASVCILPYAMSLCSKMLEGSTVRTSTTIGFPHGAQSTDVKRFEAERAIADGCQELDMVVNISCVRSGQWDYVRDDIGAVIEVAHQADRQVKVIFENCYLNEEQKIKLCEICSALNADWAKTSTGFGTGGATIDDIKLMRKHCAPHVQIKAAGGIRTYDTLLQMRELGVTTCGASATQQILDECRRQLNLPEVNTEKLSSSSGY
ncbi:Deoxyribose-phosphate aldolase 1 [Thalassoglobus neptunius]|uniref:Deoxyribose-phosphate aldolase n=1 Tax=Thalassoglobus neptunius TaxID=1938619 RepID=A0A5C5UZN9_9PLAN|nr:deoxyribose-phosphate aldolase [Thalassoglobus neptunius]TWT30947.1 Deoxyribose-phosphate aldolase 1 [Thalassoglobus neptunius]